MQQTLVVIKPDGLKKSLTGNVLTRLSEGKFFGDLNNFGGNDP
ncbi:MAG: hypothetical protein U9R38_05645 [Candidatus Margulisiibacteriota bacterium]|nr:hypothetical protein [Candidatus Margulisiibacteriota bacterium]